MTRNPRVFHPIVATAADAWLDGGNRSIAPWRRRMPASPSTGSAAPNKPRWYWPSIPKFLAALLLLQGLLYLSAQYHWFWFNHRKGFTVLIAVAATAAFLLLLLAWVVVSRLFRAKAQFSLAILLLMVPVMGIPCSWLAQEIAKAKRQRDILESEEKGCE
jgi:hypothetical protein